MITNFPNGASSFGMPIMPGGGVPPGGSVFWLNPSHALANDDNGRVGVGASIDAPMATLAGAFALMTANKHDVIYYPDGDTSLILSAALDWNKDRCHLIGLCAPVSVAQRSRIFQLSTLTGASPLLTISGSGCIFVNFYIFQGVNDATSKINVSVTGERNYFYNVHFAGGGHATMAIDGCVSLNINGGSENRFVHCTVGVDTIPAATGVAGLSYTDAGAAARNWFENCTFTLQAGNGGACFIESLGNTAIDRYQYFNECAFINDADGQTIDSAVVAPATNGPKVFLFRKPIFHQVTKVDANDRALVYGDVDAYTAADLSGVSVLLNV